LTKRKKIVVLGTGWGSFSFALRLNKELYDLTFVSPRNHFLFTPLLTATTVGTLEFRAICEPIRGIPNLGSYHQGRCMEIDAEKRRILVRDSFDTSRNYWLDYDALIYGVGAAANDFGIPGVKEHCHNCRQIRHAVAIRDKIMELFERASKPYVTRTERERLLSIVVVGGGPTSIEFAGQMYDWLALDGARMFPELIDCVSVSLVEATGRVLPSFKQDIADYTIQQFRKRKIRVFLNSAVNKVTESVVELKDGYEIPYGLCVWSTGVQPAPLTKSIDWLHKAPNGRLIVDDFQRLLKKNTVRDATDATIVSDEFSIETAEPLRDVFSVGDASQHYLKPLAPTAQPAKHQGYFLAEMFNAMLVRTTPEEWRAELEQIDERNRKFKNTNRGMMANIGGYKAAVAFGDGGGDGDGAHPALRRRLSRRFPSIHGFWAWFVWRSAYLTMTVSWPNKILIATYWLGTLLFGRSFTRF
jgi:NADH dehydrogenase FAD-containing subunit